MNRSQSSELSVSTTHPRWLLMTGFTSGMVVMGVEMSASRLMAPYFGASVFIWTNLIGIIMAALSLGYYLGGRWIDRRPEPGRLFSLVVLCSLYLFALPWIAPPVMSLASSGIQEGEISLVINSFLSALIIFGFPFVLLGMISPSIIRLLSEQVESAGKIAGRVYALSTIGSILGTFLPTLLFIPWIGTKRTILLFSSILLLVGLIGLGKRRLFALLLVAGIGAGTISPYYASGVPGLIAEGESGYTYLKVMQDDHYGVILQQDEGYAVHSYYHPTKVETGSYWDYLPLLPYLQREKRQQRVTAIGAAGGTIYQVLERTREPQYELIYDGAEIDSEVIELARQYFDLDSIQVDVRAQDGRIYLTQHAADIDLLFLDAYHQIYMPPHLTSLEYFELAKSRLTPNGSVVININALSRASDIYQRIVRTMQAVFGRVYVLEVGQGRFNYLIIGSQGEADFLRSLDHVPAEKENLKAHALAYTTQVDYNNGAEIITDDRPLSEVLFDKMIGEYLLNSSTEP